MTNGLEPAPPTEGERRAVAALTASGVGFSLTRHGPVRSLAEAAALRGVSPRDIVKTLVVRRGSDDYVFVLVPGDREFSWPKLRAHLRVSRVSMPGAEEALAATGYQRGTITPFGATRAWPVIADADIRGRTISMGAGAHGVAVTVAADDVIRVLGADVADLSEPEPEEAAVAVFRERHGLPGLADVHVHFAPPNLEARIFGYFDAAGPLIGREWPIRYRVGEAERVALLRAFGVRRFTSMIYPHKPGMARWLNGWAGEFASRTPECARTATFFPEPDAADYVADAITAGTRIFKCHVQVGGFDPRDPLLDPVWGRLAEAGVPTVIHAGSGPVPGSHTGPLPVREVLRRHPRLRLVIAHLGMPEYAPFLELALANENIWLDTTMTFTDFVEREAPFPADWRPRLVELADRIVLGTDLPTIPYPYVHQLESLERLELGSQWLRKVCWENGIRLLGAPPAS